MKTIRWFALSLLVLAAVLPAAAQTNCGGIAGTIFDPQGTVAPAAKVQITNMGTNQASTVGPPFTLATTNRSYSNRRQTQIGATFGGLVRIPELYNGPQQDLLLRLLRTEANHR